MTKLLNLQAFKDFLRSGQIGGMLLMVCVVISLFIANSGYKEEFSNLLSTNLGFTFGTKAYSFTVAAWINDALMLGSLPSGSGWKHFIGLGMLAGIGFTMSIFISLLSFSNEMDITEAKFAVLCASVISGLIGFMFLKSIKKTKA